MPLRDSSFSKSCHAALPTLVTTPMRNGDAAQRPPPVGFDEPGRDQPSQHLVALLGEIAQRVAGVRPSIFNDSRPVGA